MLKNNEIMTERALLSPWSPLMLDAKKALSAEQQLEAGMHGPFEPQTVPRRKSAVFRAQAYAC